MCPLTHAWHVNIYRMLLARSNGVIDIEIKKCGFLLTSYVNFLSHKSNSSVRTASKAFTVRSLFTTVIASFYAKHSKYLWTVHSSENAQQILQLLCVGDVTYPEHMFEGHSHSAQLLALTHGEKLCNKSYPLSFT